jgi:hypothetical protein
MPFHSIKQRIDPIKTGTKTFQNVKHPDPKVQQEKGMDKYKSEQGLMHDSPEKKAHKQNVHMQPKPVMQVPQNIQPDMQSSPVLTNPVQRLLSPNAAYNKKPYMIKGSLSPKITWDGSTESFPAFKDAVEGFYIQERSGYVFNKEFQTAYKRYGFQVGILGKLPTHLQVPEEQLRNVASHMFGAIQSACRLKGAARRFLTAYTDDQDGILAWIKICEAKDKGSNLRVYKTAREQMIRTPYTKNYKGGLIKYLDDIENAYADLESRDINVH